jgi:hypothetical protein
MKAYRRSRGIALLVLNFGFAFGGKNLRYEEAG